jgi:hypothetical protein
MSGQPSNEAGRLRRGMKSGTPQRSGTAPSVRPGYSPRQARPRRSREAPPSRVNPSLRRVARGIRQTVADEIVYATIDTIRLWRYLRFQMGARSRPDARTVGNAADPVGRKREAHPETGALAAEQIRAS